MGKTAIITGVTGQDGSYLAELLIKKRYKVIGVHRRSSSPNFSNLANVLNSPNFILEEGDITDLGFLHRILNSYSVNEFYNLAAQSHVKTSFDQPVTTWDITGGGVLNCLEAIRNSSPETKFYQASSSEMFGKNYSEDEYNGVGGPAYYKFQNENTPFMPQSPYAIAKLAGHHLVRNYRDSYNIFACSGILFNHESERRGENFVTRKITKWLAGYIANEKSEEYPLLRLGNLDAYRDWGHAEDYVRAMWLMLQQETPDDYVVATGRTHSIRDFLDCVFSIAGVGDWDSLVVIDPAFYRPAEVDYLLGSALKAEKVLKWKPSISLQKMAERMFLNDLAQARLQRSSLQTV